MARKRPPKDPATEASNVVELKPRKVDGRSKPWSAERKAKWLASVRKTNNKPAGGFVYKPPGESWGGPATGMPATGAGWGGPASGTTAEEGRSAPRKSREERAAQVEEIMDFYHEVVTDKTQPVGLRLAAGEKLIDRVEGKAVARSISAEADGDESWIVERRIIDKPDKAG
jgi:hypothetical protein